MSTAQDQAKIEWPARPTCHDDDFSAQRFGETIWRPAGVRLHPENDHIPAFRTCKYCGSIHPEDLVNALAAGAKLGGSDWKYGWPHKFYIDGIPNSQAGNMVSRESGNRAEMTDEERAYKDQQYADRGGRVEWKKTEGGWEYKCFEPDGATTHGKWYNAHLKDLSPEAFELVSGLLLKHAGISFVMDAGKLMFRAPHPGYQA
jgi:hypothetical protein